MNLQVRLIVLLAVIAVGVLFQQAFWSHLEAAGPLPETPLQAPLDSLPMELGDWRGVDRPIENEIMLYADQHLQRTYVHQPSGQVVSLWIAYSKEGVDRGHHPEVCMMVSGQPEDRSAREPIEVPGHPVPIQEFRFGRPGSFQRIYYWHYTLLTGQEAASDLQRLYQRMRRRPSSVTLEVFAPEVSEETPELAQDFVRLVDAAVQRNVGPGATRGSNRQPVTYIAED